MYNFQKKNTNFLILRKITYKYVSLRRVYITEFPVIGNDGKYHAQPSNQQIWHFFISLVLASYATSNGLWLVDSKDTLVVNKRMSLFAAEEWMYIF